MPSSLSMREPGLSVSFFIGPRPASSTPATRRIKVGSRQPEVAGLLQLLLYLRYFSAVYILYLDFLSSGWTDSNHLGATTTHHKALNPTQLLVTPPAPMVPQLGYSASTHRASKPPTARANKRNAKPCKPQPLVSLPSLPPERQCRTQPRRDSMQP